MFVQKEKNWHSDRGNVSGLGKNMNVEKLKEREPTFSAQ